MSGPVKDGIDVSEHNGDITWSRVAGDAGFCFIKSSEGRTYEDALLTPGRVHAATKAMPGRIGFYHFARPDRNRARDEAEHFVRTVRRAGGKLGRNGVLDYEVAHPGGHDEAWIKAWIDAYKRLTGERPIIYGGSVLRERTASNFGCPLWLAAYVSNPAPYVPSAWNKRGGWRLWQFTERGVCKGIRGPVDRNRFRGDRKALKRVLG